MHKQLWGHVSNRLRKLGSFFSVACPQYKGACWASMGPGKAYTFELPMISYILGYDPAYFQYRWNIHGTFSYFFLIKTKKENGLIQWLKLQSRNSEIQSCFRHKASPETWGQSLSVSRGKKKAGKTTSSTLPRKLVQTVARSQHWLEGIFKNTHTYTNFFTQKTAVGIQLRPDSLLIAVGSSLFPPSEPLNLKGILLKKNPGHLRHVLCISVTSFLIFPQLWEMNQFLWLCLFYILSNSFLLNKTYLICSFQTPRETSSPIYLFVWIADDCLQMCVHINTNLIKWWV